MIEETMKINKIMQRDVIQWALWFIKILIHSRVLEKKLEKKTFQGYPKYPRVFKKCL